MAATITLQSQGRAYRFPPVEAIVFDKDGTLATVEDYLTDLYTARLQQLSLPRTLQRDRQFGITAEGVDPAGLLAVGTRQENEILAAAHLAQTGLSWIVARQRVQTAFENASLRLTAKAPRTPLMSGVPDLFRQLQSASLKLVIASADTQANVDEFVAHYELLPYLTYCQGVSYQHPDKTHKDFLLAICQQIGVSPYGLLVCGDSDADWAMAEVGGAAGFIGFTGGWRHPVKLQMPQTTSRRLANTTICGFHQVYTEVDE